MKMNSSARRTALMLVMAFCILSGLSGCQTQSRPPDEQNAVIRQTIEMIIELTHAPVRPPNLPEAVVAQGVPQGAEFNGIDTYKFSNKVSLTFSAFPPQSPSYELIFLDFEGELGAAHTERCLEFSRFILDHPFGASTRTDAEGHLIPNVFWTSDLGGGGEVHAWGSTSPKPDEPALRKWCSRTREIQIALIRPMQ